jgi:hypothetical protein
MRPRIFADVPLRQCFVGYIDILGFGKLVCDSLERAQTLYDDILRTNDLLPTNGAWQTRPDDRIDITAVSDSFLVVGEEIQPVASWCAGIQRVVMSSHLLVRGGIGYGRHLQKNIHEKGRSRHHVLAISEALVFAAGEEKRRDRPPCGITLHSSVPAKPIEELDAGRSSNSQRVIVYWEGSWLINPFGKTDAIEEARLVKMREQHRGTAEAYKYDWLFEFFQQIKADHPLRPQK